MLLLLERGVVNFPLVADKTINVRMSDSCHNILKAYCVLVGKTMSEVLYDWTRQELHNQALICKAVSHLMETNNLKLDARNGKPCWGYRCNLCAHETACRVGKEDKLFIMEPKWHPYLNPEYEYVKTFDGSSIDPM